MSQRLIIEDDEGTTTIVPLGKDAVTIGRQQGNTIQLTEKNVSRRHARLYPEQAAWVIEDLGSYNGVKVNGVAIGGRVTLKEGDVVQIGDYHLALTEDVDKRTLNYQSGAANDVGVAEPMLASSSTDLPRLSADELAALQSGPQPATAPPLLDSGPVPTTPPPIGYEDRKKGGAGVLIGFGAVIGIALLAGVAWMAASGGADEPENKVAVAEQAEKAEPPPAEDPQKPPLEAEAFVPSPSVPEPADVADDGAEIIEEPTDSGEAPQVEDEPEVVDSGDEPDVVVPDDSPEPPPDAKAGNDKRDQRKSRKKKAKRNNHKRDSGSSKPPPQQPAVDAGALLKDARKIGLTQPRKGYDLARQALKAGGGRAAAKLMATMACRIPDAGKAKRALSRLKGADHDSVAKICRAKGIEV